MSDPQFEVVWPLSPQVSDSVKLPARLPSLEGKVIAELWNWLYKGDRAFALIREELMRRYPGLSFVPFDVFGNIFGAEEHKVIERLPALLKERGCDGAIVAFGH